MQRNIFAHMPGRSFSSQGLGAADAGGFGVFQDDGSGGTTQLPTPMFPLPSGGDSKEILANKQPPSNAGTIALVAIGIVAVGAGAYFVFR